MGSPASIFDSLYCSEEHWVDFYDGPHEFTTGGVDDPCPGLWGSEEGNADEVGGWFDRDLFWDDRELASLSSKEESCRGLLQSVRSDRFLENARAEAVEWMMKVHSYYGFSAPTAVLAVNYLDRFLFKFHCETGDEDERSPQRKQQQPWMTQLTAVACLSLAAKVEETQVPLLLDLQVDESRDLFDAKTVRKMELLVLSTLQWRMNPVTPLSFLDHLARRLGLKGHLCQEFIRRSELVMLHVIPDPRFLQYLPSVMAASVMLHIVDSFDPSTKARYLDQLSGTILGIEKGIMDECRDLVSELAARDWTPSHRQHHSNKRKYRATTTQHIPGSPCGVADACFSCPSSDSECSSDSWSVAPGDEPAAASPSEALPKKSRTLFSSFLKE